jgi:hypothetical protein
MQYLVDELFIGDKLTRSEIASDDQKIFDLRNISSPIIIFTSLGDNISPPPQTLGWILDLYCDVDEIRDAGRTIIYCLDQTAGHLAIFVSSRVGAEEDEELVRLMDVIDRLPAGLYEMIISPRPAASALDGLATSNWISRFEPRTLDDIRAFGRNSDEDYRAFATVARVSEINLATYRAFLQPLVRAWVNPISAEMLRQLNSLRLSYTLFSDSNPFMAGVRQLAQSVKSARRPVDIRNTSWQLQECVSNEMEIALKSYGVARDLYAERLFFALYGSPVLQSMLGVDGYTGKRPHSRQEISEKALTIQCPPK